MKSSSSWGAERLKWPEIWTIRKNHENTEDKMEFQGEQLEIKCFYSELYPNNSKNY